MAATGAVVGDPGDGRPRPSLVQPCARELHAVASDRRVALRCPGHAAGSLRALRALLEPPLRPWSLEWFSLGRVVGRARLGAGGHCSRKAGRGLGVIEAVPPALAVAPRSLPGS